MAAKVSVRVVQGEDPKLMAKKVLDAMSAQGCNPDELRAFRHELQQLREEEILPKLMEHADLRVL
jgi:hypothetical protein